MNFQAMSIQEIKDWLEQIHYDPQEEDYLKLLQEKRSGVKTLLKKIETTRKKRQQEQILWNEMSIYERSLYEQGYSYIAGIDEVGRGPLAGPVVCAAVILSKDFYLPGLKDSKLLSKEQRETFYDIIMEQAIAVSIATISVDTIDQINILQATRQGMMKVIEQLDPQPQYLLIDAVQLNTSIPQLGIIGGDRKSISIAAASVVAKVTRDRHMAELAEKYPQYGFDRNMGYGTKEHLEAIQQYGVSDVHRKTFAGVKEWVSVGK